MRNIWTLPCQIAYPFICEIIALQQDQCFQIFAVLGDLKYSLIDPKSSIGIDD